MGILKIFPLLGNKALICSYSCSLCSACKENLPQMDLEFTGELHRQPKHKMLRYASPDPSFPRFSTVFVSLALPNAHPSTLGVNGPGFGHHAPKILPGFKFCPIEIKNYLAKNPLFSSHGDLEDY